MNSCQIQQSSLSTPHYVMDGDHNSVLRYNMVHNLMMTFDHTVYYKYNVKIFFVSFQERFLFRQPKMQSESQNLLESRSNILSQEL